MRSKDWPELAVLAEIIGVFALLIGAFLFLQYNNVSSLCPPGADYDPCRKFEIRSDAGIGLMVLGALGLAYGFIAGWLKDRRARQKDQFNEDTD
jgi:hypothetical protein